MTKPMSKNISPNKLSDSDRKRAESIRERLIKDGIGEDEAWHRAIELAVEEGHSGSEGGRNSGGGPNTKSGES